MILCKITKGLVDEIVADLSRPHPFAFERVGFLTMSAGHLRSGMILLAISYLAVPDDGYVEDDRAAAVINETTIRRAMQIAYTSRVGIAHIHLHDHKGPPGFSGIDEVETSKFMPPFTSVCPERPHAAIIKSRDSFVGRCWINNIVSAITEFQVIGDRLWSTR